MSDHGPAHYNAQNGDFQAPEDYDDAPVAAYCTVGDWDEIVAAVGRHHFMVDDLQATEPGELLRGTGMEPLPEAPFSMSPYPGIWVTVGPELDSMGFHRVEVRATTRAQLLAFVRDNWGAEDSDWWESHVVGRILELGAPDAPARRRVVVARYDVTGLEESEVDYLCGELSAQAEESDGHPGVEMLGLDEVDLGPTPGDEDLLTAWLPRARVSDHDREHMQRILLDGYGDWFSAYLLRAIAKADANNLRVLASAYPDHVEAFVAWRDHDRAGSPR